MHKSFNFSFISIQRLKNRIIPANFTPPHRPPKLMLSEEKKNPPMEKHTAGKSNNTYLQNLNKIFSNTKTGPVLPNMVRGCPPKRE